MQSFYTPTQKTELPETIKGIDTRLLAASARYEAARAVDDRGRTPATRAELQAARTELLAVRGDAMTAALKAAGAV